MPAPDKVLELVDRFDRNLNAYKQGRYNETQVRREFIDPLFKALGWDVDNEQGYAEAYKDVVHEDAIKVGGATKAPDYCFRIGGARKFFLEAKKPSVNIKAEIHPAYQLRRYAWSAKLPLSILTDFEEFAVYDCRLKPAQTDQPAVARTLYLTYRDYAGRWDDIAGVFSREAVLKGSFDQYVDSHKARRGTAEVDAAFLGEIERWRELLARNIALRNPELNQRQLNFAVQRTIDRLIFLRIGEDRGLEPYGHLMALQNGTEVYQRLLYLFRQADDRYNAGLFHFRPEPGRPEEDLDTLTPGLRLDDRVLKDILKNLYYPDSPYEFSVLPADILGQVYEQFLGKVIRLTPAHRAVVEDKPEVKKAGGVYYTPTYIVDYIVRQTVGQLVEGKKAGPRGAASKLKILDPACGSGSFLLGAYQFLLDWHRDQYVNDPQGPERWATGGTPRLFRGPGGDWRLTTDERKRILLNNIYGVDIDPQAVEVTKLSLLLKVLEGETAESIATQLSFFQERVLPDLGRNIKCGNSLIGPDFYDERQLSFLDEEEMFRLNVFDWQAEFPEILAAGGFDAVIGNPPYLFITEQDKSEKLYFSQTYTTYSYRYDVYGLFVEQAFGKLLRDDGHFGFIIPHTLLNNDSFETLRRFLLERTTLNSIIDLGPGVFQGAKNETMLLFAQNRPSAEDSNCSILKSDKDLSNLQDAHSIPQKWFLELPKAAFLITADQDSITLLEKLRSTHITLGNYCTINQGLRTGNNEKYTSPTKQIETHRPAIGGKNIARYFIRDHFFVQYEPEKLDAPRKESIFTSPEKLIVQEVRNITLPRRIIAAYDDQQFYCLQTTNVINLRDNLRETPSLKYLLGLLNSTLLNWFFRISFPSNNHIASNQLSQLPIHPIDFDDPADRARHDQLVALVERMLELHRQLAAAQTPQAKTVLRRQIAATDRQIDQLVYALYDLTEAEIGVVEGNTG